ncbi:MAG: hypothetical protein RBT20_02825 [Syntrophales bacterium]|jgi:hypothetical protein|nr:hypothetical protein [Syntrophales bacterium]
MDKVDADGLGLLKKFLADQKSDAFFLEYLVFSLRLIQSHSQRGTRSATLVQEDPYRFRSLSSLEEFIEHLFCKIRNFDHNRPFQTKFLVAMAIDAVQTDRLSKCKPNLTIKLFLSTTKNAPFSLTGSPDPL